jgi:hypothetical protein
LIINFFLILLLALVSLVDFQINLSQVSSSEARFAAARDLPVLIAHHFCIDLSASLLMKAS